MALMTDHPLAIESTLLTHLFINYLEKDTGRRPGRWPTLQTEDHRARLAQDAAGGYLGLFRHQPSSRCLSMR
jgi:hypothetical protein